MSTPPRSGSAFADEAISRGRELVAKPVAGEVRANWSTACAARNRLCSRPARCSTRWTARPATSAGRSARCPRRSTTSRTASTRPPSQLAQGGLGKCDRAVGGARRRGQGRHRRAEHRRDRPAGRLHPADPGRRRSGPAAGGGRRGARGRRAAAAGPTSRRCSPRSRGCARCRTTSTPAAAASGRRPAPGSTRRCANWRPPSPRRTTNITEAIAHANGASLLAAQAQQLANDDVQAGQRQYQERYGGGQSDMGAMVGGIILGNILTGGFGGGGFGGGGGGWTSTTYGGSPGRRRRWRDARRRRPASSLSRSSRAAR